MNSSTPAPVIRPWVVSPVFDLLFLANLTWPLLFLPGVSDHSSTHIDFWQIYYLTLPHRWITLVLVLLDPDRRVGKSRSLIVVGLGIAVVVGGVYVGTGALLCLALVDYVWNAWHFASQHAGVLRIYSKKVRHGSPTLDKWGLRIFVTYAALRAAGWATGWMAPGSVETQLLSIIDYALLLIPILMLAHLLSEWRAEYRGKLAYLGSVLLLYSGLILSLQMNWSRAIVVLATAGSLFHAVEYLAIVTHYAWNRQTLGSPGRFRQLAAGWITFLIMYLVVLGSIGVWMSNPANKLVLVWQGLNLWMAFVHYAFDGMIWKLRQPQTSAALGAGPS